MSSRRKGKPQQRKKIEALEPEQDYLTCGDCQREFLLSDIVKFIQHKVNRCNKKENASDPFTEDSQYEDGGEESLEGVDGSGVINARRTSISAPISSRRGTPEAGGGNGGAPSREKMSPRPSRPLSSTGAEEAGSDDDEDVDHDHDHESNDVEVSAKTNGCKNSSSSRVENGGVERNSTTPSPRKSTRSMVDAESNTSSTEPDHFQCCSCKSKYSSAWLLVQHVQKSHGLRIYVDKNKNVERGEGDEGSRVRTPSSKPSSTSPKCESTLKTHLKRETSESSPTPKPKEERGCGMTVPHLPATSLHSKSILAQPRPASSPPPMTSMGVDMSQAPPYIFRMPTGDRTPMSPVLVNHHSPFSRPSPGDFRLDIINDTFPRIPGLPGLSPHSFEPPPAMGSYTSHSPYERQLRHPLSPAVPMDTGSAQDFYSQRLRILAGNSDPVSPSAKVVPSVLGQGTFSSPPPANSPDAAGGDTSPKSSSGGTTPGKVKACEFCGKCFRFQSNLIVHRRSHTGEKPFKCPMCPHACTQASKLKRHMKTHSQRHHGGLSSSLSQASSMSTGSDNSMRSSSSTPESKPSKVEGEDSEESDSEDEERAMEEARKMGAIQDEPTDLSTPTTMAKKLQFFADDSNEAPTDLSVGEKEARASLLREVMEKTGLDSIQAYKEAFNQAVAESNRRDMTSRKSPGSAITENGHPEHEKGGKANERGGYRRNSSASQDNDSGPENKRIKTEPREEQLNNATIPPGMEPFFHRIWFPPTGTPRDYIIGMSGMTSGVMTSPEHLNPVSHSQENGLHSSLHHDGGYKVDSLVNNPKPSTSLTSLGLAPSLAPSPTVSNPSPLVGVRKDTQRRNDTCEFCGKVFKNCSNLTVHRRSHTGEKPYRCQLCSYACAQSSKLTRHMKTHGRMGKDVYRCKFCNMPFSVPSTLEKHMRKCVENQNPGSVSASSTPGTNSITSVDSPILPQQDNVSQTESVSKVEDVE